MSEVKTNKISPATGTAFTLGDSGDTFTVPDGGALTIASGATITNSGTASGLGGGKVLQVVNGTDATQYALTSSSASTDQAGSSAFSITPSATSSEVMVHFQIGQVMSKDGSGIRMRIYRQIAGGGYSHLTALSGTASASRPAAFAGNFGSHTDGEDANRTRTIGGHFVDSPNTTSQVDYKLYFGQGDTGTRYIYVNRTRGNGDAAYSNQTKTHVTLMEIGA